MAHRMEAVPDCDDGFEPEERWYAMRLSRPVPGGSPFIVAAVQGSEAREGIAGQEGRGGAGATHGGHRKGGQTAQEGQGAGLGG
eukprot:98136-Prymnesium_polylepis.1